MVKLGKRENMPGIAIRVVDDNLARSMEDSRLTGTWGFGGDGTESRRR